MTAIIGDALEVLRAEYLTHLPGLIAELAALAAQAPSDAQARTRARAAAHRLRGTAGSYGFAHVGEVAGRIEDALDEGTSVPSELLQSLGALASGL